MIKNKRKQLICIMPHVFQYFIQKTSIIMLFLYASILFGSLLFTICFSLRFLNKYVKINITFSDEIMDSKYLFILSRNYSKFSQTSIINKSQNQDQSTLIDIKNFKFIINHNICNKTNPILLMLIHSAPANLRKRNVIRETWGKTMSSINTFFIVGYSEVYNENLKQEDMQHKDLIQGNFLDSYRNMTYKHVMALKWVTYYCSNAKYILKLDDDVFVNVYTLMAFLKKLLLLRGASRLILCDAISTPKVKRSWRSKWHVSPREYPDKEYPTYCSGWAILYTLDSVLLLYQEAQKHPFFWIDDVHITGTLAKRKNLTAISIHSMIISEHMMKILFQKLSIKKAFFFGPPNLRELGIRALHDIVSNK